MLSGSSKAVRALPGEHDVSQDELVGRKVGNYELKKLLGRGGMGLVYLAEHPRIGRKVAVKVMSSAFSQLPHAAERFEAEAKLITRVCHPNIIEIYDFGSLDDGSLYYVMELLSGRELAEVLREHGRLGARQAVPYVEQICAGLQAAHDLGVVHRDLKPENIFVLDGEPLVVKILDFGIAKLLEDGGEGGGGLTKTGMVMGTPLYIAPEQAAGEPHRISALTDVYSLGAVLYRVLGGVTPFVDSAPGRLIASHITKEPPPLSEHEPGVPAGVAELVHRCLSKEPEDRPGSAAEVAREYRSRLGRDLWSVVSDQLSVFGEGGPADDAMTEVPGSRLGRDQSSVVSDQLSVFGEGGPADDAMTEVLGMDELVSESVQAAPPPAGAVEQSGPDLVATGTQDLGSAETAPPAAAVTTLGSSTGQVTAGVSTEAVVGTRPVGKIAAVAVAAALLVLGAVLLLSRDAPRGAASSAGQPPGEVATPAAQPPPADVTAPALDAPGPDTGMAATADAGAGRQDAGVAPARKRPAPRRWTGRRKVRPRAGRPSSPRPVPKLRPKPDPAPPPATPSKPAAPGEEGVF